MATVTVPRNDIYLSMLAGRALTALADLSANPSAWNERIRKELENGVEYCQFIRACRPETTGTSRLEGQQAVRRLAEDNREPQPENLSEEAQAVEHFLRELLGRTRNAEAAELLAAIKFFSRDMARQGP